MSTQTNPRSIATDLIRSAARDIDTLGISEYLEGRDIDDPGAGITEQVDELIRKATVSVDWPAAEGGEPAAELDLAAIEARANTATEGPWTTGEDGLVWPPHMGDPVSGSIWLPDSQFIAAARTDVPALVAEVRRLRAALGEIAGMCNCHVAEDCPSLIARRALTEKAAA